MNFRPLHDRVLVRRIEAEEKTAGGIIIPDSAKEKPSEGEVVAVGSGARSDKGKITPPELSGATFTVSNLGMYGVSNFHPVINSPQAAILAVGAIAEAPVVRDGEVGVRPLMELTLTCDHRILYGADAAQFLGRIRERLENPLSLAL